MSDPPQVFYKWIVLSCPKAYYSVTLFTAQAKPEFTNKITVIV